MPCGCFSKERCCFIRRSVSSVRFLWVSQEVAIATESSNNERKWTSVVKDRLVAIDPESKLVQLLLSKDRQHKLAVLC